MTIQIIAEKIVTTAGDNVYKIKKVKALPSEKLPKIYKQSLFYCFYENYLPPKSLKLILPTTHTPKHMPYSIYAKYNCCTLTETYSYSVAAFNEYIGLIKECGKRLKKCNKQLNDLRKQWKGVVTISI